MPTNYPFAIKRVNETDKDYIIRAFDYATAQVERYYMLQSERRIDGYYGSTRFYASARFYQQQARIWFVRAEQCREDYLRLLDTLIPFTDVRTDEIFIDRKAIKLALSSALPRMPRITTVTPRPLKGKRSRQTIVDEAIFSQPQTPREKYNNPRDIAMTMNEIMLRLLKL